MKKHTIKILSLCLSLMLMLSSLPMNIFAAVDTGATVETNHTKVATLESDIANGNKNIVLTASTASTALVENLNQ